VFGGLSYGAFGVAHLARNASSHHAPDRRKQAIQSNKERFLVDCALPRDQLVEPCIESAKESKELIRLKPD
jgi:hypothetical protein